MINIFITIIIPISSMFNVVIIIIIVVIFT